MESSYAHSPVHHDYNSTGTCKQIEPNTTYAYLAFSYLRYILMSSRHVMDFAIQYIVMYVSTLFLNNFTLNILFVNSLQVK